MKNATRRLSNVLAACALAALSTGAPAAPLTASFSGAVTGYEFDSYISGQIPLGTAVSWSFTFDDSFSALDATGDVFGTAAQSITGSAQVGGDVITLNHFGLFSYSYNSSDFSIISYRAQVQGTGPMIGGGPAGGDFFGLFITLDPLLTTQTNLRVGYGYSNDFGTDYDYLQVEGAARIAPAQVVPLPPTIWLLLAPFAWLVWRRGKGSA